MEAASVENVALSHRLAYGAIAVLALALLGGAGLLWARNGGALFFDAIASGIAACL